MARNRLSVIRRPAEKEARPLLERLGRLGKLIVFLQKRPGFAIAIIFWGFFIFFVGYTPFDGDPIKSESGEGSEWVFIGLAASTAFALLAAQIGAYYQHNRDLMLASQIIGEAGVNFADLSMETAKIVKLEARLGEKNRELFWQAVFAITPIALIFAFTLGLIQYSSE